MWVFERSTWKALINVSFFEKAMDPTFFARLDKLYFLNELLYVLNKMTKSQINKVNPIVQKIPKVITRVSTDK